jgi:hypothetical protein
MRLTPGSMLLLAAAYFVAAELGLALVETHGNVSPVWPPTGIAIAGLLILGARAGRQSPRARFWRTCGPAFPSALPSASARGTRSKP